MITYVKRCFSATPNLPSPQTQLRSSLVRAIKVFLLAGVLPTTTFAATIQGIAFEDINDNGIFDSGEPPLSYTTIFIRENNKADAGEGGFFTTYTDENGEYSSIAHDPGPFTIWGEIPAGWIQTMPVRGEGIAMFDVEISEPNQNLTVDFGFFNPDSMQPPPDDTTNPPPSDETNQPPQANFTLSPPEGQAPLTVNFDGNSSFDPEDQIIQYEWLMPDGFVFGTEPETTFTFNDPGTYEIKLVVTDNTGQIGDKTAIVTVWEPEAPQEPQEPPVAKLTIEPDRGVAPLIVELDGNNSFDPDGEIVGCEWLIAGKPPVDSCKARVTFDEPGEYEVTLIVTDNHGLSNQEIKVVFVEEQPKNDPIANMSVSPRSGDAPLTVSANGNGSSDPDGNIVNYQWTVSDGRTASGSQANFTFNSAGQYTIVLEVTDNDGLSATTEETVTVEEKPKNAPTANMSVNPISGKTPLTVSANGNNSFDSDGEIVGYQWRVSDGKKASGPQANFTFNSAGQYTISLVVTDNDGLSATTEETVTVEGKPKNAPTANMSVSPRSGDAPLTVSANGNNSSDSDGEIVDYQWTVSDAQKASGSKVNFTFDSAGQYTIFLEVTDNDGLSATTQQTISVSTAPNPNSPPTAAFVATPTEGDSPLTVTLNGRDSVDSDGEVVHYKWTASNGQKASGANATTTFTFDKAGTYTISLVVTDDKGDISSTANQTITVNKPKAPQAPPIALLEISPKEGEAPLTVNLYGSLSIDPDGSIASYDWKASDGQEAFEELAEMIFDIPGKYRITLEVKDNDGLVSAKVWEIVTVTESGTGTPPVAKIGEIPASGQAPFTLVLDASSSFDPDGGEIVYEWTVSSGKTSLKSTDITTSFILEKAGNCTVVLTVTDDEELTDSTSQTILITKEEVEVVRVSFAGLNESYAVGDKVTVDLIEQVKTNRFNRVDLWVAIQIPSGELLFRTPLPLVPFSIQPQPLKESLESSDSTTRLLDFEVIPGISGTYTFYALYLKEGSEPLKEGLEATQRSNLAIQSTTLE
jgi:PKD repeat protein